MFQKKYTIQDAHNVAKKHGGKCLTEEYEYVNSQSRGKWQCVDGHVWEATFTRVFHGSWCPYCRGHWNEEKCRYAFENICNLPFRKNKDILPGFILDGYNEELKMAFEYNGKQHYDPIDYFGGEERFNSQVKRDERLRIKCKEKGIFLIEVPYTCSETDDILVKYICECLGRDVNTKIDWNKFYNLLSALKPLRKIAKGRGGELVSNVYYGTNGYLIWRCKDGHEWQATPMTIKKGSWCPTCSRTIPHTLEEAKKIAISRGGECISTEYISNKKRLKWRCSEGHEWETSFSNVYHNGTWCSVCAGKKKHTIEQMQELAKERRGKCLSEKYKDSLTKLKWECFCGCQWEATPSSVLSGVWCPHCSGRERLTLEDMQQLAKEHGGECLSKEYVNANEKMPWRCKEGHEWWSTPSGVRNCGKWCRKCSVNERYGEKEDKKCEYCGKIFTGYKNNKKHQEKRFCSRECVYLSKRDRTACLICGKENPVHQKTCSKKCHKEYRNKYINPVRLEEMKRMAEEKEGKCLSEKYEESYIKLQWQCKKGHVFWSKPTNVQQGRWCRECAIENSRGKIRKKKQ